MSSAEPDPAACPVQDGESVLRGNLAGPAATAEPLDLAPEPADVQPADLPERWREAFEERAGIMEYDACMTRQDAERFALADILGLMRAAGEL